MKVSSVLLLCILLFVNASFGQNQLLFNQTKQQEFLLNYQSGASGNQAVVNELIKALAQGNKIPIHF